ncbi:chemotaxis protein CheX [candidate division FCPU426 bacterium]|nr:chemotaxis protein CheX [candidate division FCPU426 bacterium]
MRDAQETLRQAVQDIFQEVAGISLGAEALPPAGVNRVQACVLFRGQCAGSLILDVPAALLTPITQTMLGDLSLAYDRGQQLDALGEMANILCGNLVGRLFDAAYIIDLETPQVRECQEARESRPGETLGIRLGINGDSVNVIINMHAEEAQYPGGPSVVYGQAGGESGAAI